MGKNPVSGARVRREGKSIEPTSRSSSRPSPIPTPVASRCLRVFGCLKPDSVLVNLNRGSIEKLGQVTLLQGKTPVPIPELRAGDIARPRS